MEPWETVRARLIATGKWRLATQGELNNSNAALEGQTIHVAGLGEGKVVKFLKNGGWGVHSAHTIDFSSPAFDGSDVREVKLKRKSNNETEWLKAVTEVRPRKTFSVTAAVPPTPPTFVCIRMIILPRQAPDKHRKGTLENRTVFSQMSPGGGGGGGGSGGGGGFKKKHHHGTHGLPPGTPAHTIAIFQEAHRLKKQQTGA